jgi:hypothetical protein
MFALKGSKYEAVFDANGNKINEEEINNLLDNKKTDAYSNAMDVDT